MNAPLPPTKLTALDIMLDRRTDPKFKPNEEDKALVQKVIEYVKSLSNVNNNEYVYNIQTILEKEYISIKELGFAASMIPFMVRQQKESLLVTTKKESEYVGNEGSKVQLKMKPVVLSPYESQWGTGLLVRFEDECGNILVWFASNAIPADFTMNEFKTFKFTIKKHETYKDSKQTIVNRVKEIK